MKPLPPAHRHDPQEELVNILTHGAGFLLSILGLVLLLIKSIPSGDLLRITCVAVYGFSLVLLYGASAAYHYFYRSPFVFKLRIVDHAAIYILIAGSYTPYTLLVLPGALGTGIFITIWILAIAGVIFKLFFTGKFRRLDALMYLGMGWLAIIAIKPMMQNLPFETLFWIVAGGIAYSAGVIFYLWEKLKFNHGIWHLFVLCGSFCHWVGVYGWLAA